MRVAERARALVEGGRPWILVATLIVAQWLAVGLFALTVQRNGWLFYQGGDQTWFYTSAWVLSEGRIPETFVSWLWATVLTPVAAIAGPDFLTAVPVVVLLQYLFLLPLGLALIYAIASRIGGRPLGVWAAAWWIAIPYLAAYLFVDRYHDTYVEQTLPQGLGLTGLGDFPSMIAVLTAAYFAVRALDTRSRIDVVAAGLLVGLAIGIKPANGLFALAPVAMFALARRWRAIPEFALAILPGLVVLALWKYRGSGIALLATEPIRLAAAEQPDFSEPGFWARVRDYVPLDVDQLNYQFLGFREYFWSARLLEFLPVAGVIAVARRSIPLAGLLAVWLASFFVVKASSTAVNVESGSIWRLLMPAWPAYFLLAASLPLLAPRVGGRLAQLRVDTPAVPGGRRTLAIGAAAAFAVPALAFAVLPSDDSGRAAKIPLRSLFLPIDDGYRLSATTDDNGFLRLTWPERPREHARPYYVLLRSPSEFTFPGTSDVVQDGLRCRSPEGGGSERCSIEMAESGRTRQRFWSERPPTGRWTYRVGVAANWLDDPDQGDILVVSGPLTVDVG